jgi:hypothetical protein
MDLPRHGRMDRPFDQIHAPSTWGAFLRLFTVGHVPQLNAVAAKSPIPVSGVAPDPRRRHDGGAFVDIDDTVTWTYGRVERGIERALPVSTA